MVKEAWAVYMTLFDLSIALRELNISHNVIEFNEDSTNGKSKHRYKNINLGFPQPAMPFLLSTIADIPKLYKIEYPCIAFIAASQHEISISNVRLLERTENLIYDVKYALIESLKGTKDFILEYNEPSLMDYVKVASKPSILNQIQNAWYKVNPYSDRKIVQNTVIQYLSGIITLTRAKSVLSKTLKMQSIADMLATQEATNLKLATMEAKHKGGIAEIAESYNLDPFDINYLLASRNKGVTKTK